MIEVFLHSFDYSSYFTLIRCYYNACLVSRKTRDLMSNKHIEKAMSKRLTGVSLTHDQIFQTMPMERTSQCKIYHYWKEYIIHWAEVYNTKFELIMDLPDRPVILNDYLVVVFEDELEIYVFLNAILSDPMTSGLIDQEARWALCLLRNEYGLIVADASDTTHMRIHQQCLTCV